MEAPIETFIKDFVWARTGETVYTDLSTPSVVLLRDVKTCGSTALAALWLNILQHPNNYPVQRYPYRKLYQTNGTYKVVLTVDDVTLTVSMSLGSLKMKGEFILHWFQSNFLKVLDAYGRPWANPQPLDDKYSKLRKTWENLPSVKHSAVVVIENKTEVRESRKEAVTEYKEETNSENKEADTTEEKVVENPPEENDDLMDLKEALQNVNKERGSDEDIMKQIASLSTGCVQHGPDYIYILWKSLLEQWFKDADNRVYIVTPQLDVDRLKDVVQLVLDQRLTANLEALYVHQKCTGNLIENIGDVKATVQKQYPSKDQVFIEYKIYSNIIYPLAEFQCKFIACIKKGKVTVLQTSANFHADHFVKESVDTVSFHRMSKDEFHQRFLKPILASQFLQVNEK